MPPQPITLQLKIGEKSAALFIRQDTIPLQRLTATVCKPPTEKEVQDTVSTLLACRVDLSEIEKPSWQRACISLLSSDRQLPKLPTLPYWIFRSEDVDPLPWCSGTHNELAVTCQQLQQLGCRFEPIKDKDVKVPKHQIAALFPENFSDIKWMRRRWDQILFPSQLEALINQLRGDFTSS
jgi:hypothetical protein